MAKIILRNTEIGGKWTPEKIKNLLAFWYDPSESSKITTIGSQVTYVEDKSNNNYDLSVLTAGKIGPTIGNRNLNGLNVFEYPSIFPNSDVVLENNSFTYDQASSPLCIAMIVRCDEDFVFDQDFIFSGTEGSPRIAMRRSVDNNIEIFSGTFLIKTPNGSAPEGQTILVVAKFNSTTSTVRINGTQLASGNIGTTPFSSINIGANEGEQQQVEGFIAEIVGFTDPSYEEIIEGYLSNKWGMLNILPNEHPYKNINSTTSVPKVILNDSAFWTPEQIITSLWLDAQDSSTVILNGNNVSQWIDKSGNSRHATQNTASFQPYYEQNGINQKPSINYNSLANNKLQLDTTISITENMSVFSVFRRETTGIWTIDVGCDVLNSRPHGFMWVTTNFLYNGLGQGPLEFVIFGNSTSVGNYIAQTTRNATTSQIWLNGSKFGNDKTALSVGGELYWVGHRLAQSHSGLMGEIIVINQSITDQIKQKIEGYLAWKWDLTSRLPVNHPYKLERPKK